MEAQKERRKNRCIGRRMVGWMDGWKEEREGRGKGGRGLRAGVTGRMEERIGEKIGKVIIISMDRQIWPNC